MNIYIMRHGLTVWNEIGRSQGHSHNMLSATGKKQVEKASEQYKNEKFDLIYCSPLRRAVQTANIMNKYHNVKIVKDNRLIEIDRGIFTGRLKKTFTEKEKGQYKIQDKSCHMESFQSLLVRVKDFVKNIILPNKEQNLLIITHGDLATFIEYILTNVDIESIIKNEHVINIYDNAEIHKVEI